MLQLKYHNVQEHKGAVWLLEPADGFPTTHQQQHIPSLWVLDCNMLELKVKIICLKRDLGVAFQLLACV